MRARRGILFGGRPLKVDVRERVLTTLDKCLHLAFVLVTLTLMVAGTCLPIIFLIPPEQLPEPGHNFTLRQSALCLGSMALGLVVSLVICGWLSRRFASAATHERWREYLLDNPYVPKRYAGYGRILAFALIPKERRALSNQRVERP